LLKAAGVERVYIDVGIAAHDFGDYLVKIGLALPVGISCGNLFAPFQASSKIAVGTKQSTATDKRCLRKLLLHNSHRLCIIQACWADSSVG
jgi:hypothetical protein